MGSAQDLFGQLWKEYALSDSRYLTSDPFVLCMETVTAVCLLSSTLLPHLMVPQSNSFFCPVHLGSPLLHRSRLHNNLPRSASPAPNHRLCRPDLWLGPILRNEHVRSLLQGGYVFAAGILVLLGILFLYELHLDGLP